MKICFVIKRLDFFISHRLDLAINLAKTNSVSVITNTHDESIAQIEKISNHEIKIYHLEEREGSANIFSYISYISSLKKLILKIRPDSVYFVTLEMSFIGALINHFISVKNNFFLITGLGPFFFNSRLKYRLARNLQKISFLLLPIKKNHKFIFQNSEDLKTFKDLGFAKNSQMILIPGNGINIKYFAFHKRAKNKNMIFLFASRLVNTKGFNEFLSAALSISKKYDNAKFLVAGKYDVLDPDSISETNYKKLMNSKKISYLGHLPHSEMRECFNQSSVFVLPSYGEGLPKVCLEAASTGLPIITTNVRGCRDCVKDTHNGFLINPMNAKELEDAMESMILLDTTNLSKYGKHSSEMVKSKYSLDIITQEYLKINSK